MSAADSKYSRRVFLARGGVAVGLATVAPSILAACGGGEEAGPNCVSPPGLTAEERTKRTQLNYVEASPDPARKCSACTFFTAGESPTACGPCSLGLGAVNPEGTCDSFAPRT